MQFLADARFSSFEPISKRDDHKSNLFVSDLEIKIWIRFLYLKIYDGTILDGVIIDSESNIISSKSDKEKPKIQFMVNDVFVLAGKSLINTDYKIAV